MQLCYVCHETKPPEDFSPGNNRCRPCHTQYQRDRRKKLAEKNQAIDMTGTKACSTCKLEKPKTEFGVAKGITDGLQTQCNGCRAVSRKAYNTSVGGHLRNMLASARRRVKASGHEFSLDTDFMVKLWERQQGGCYLTKIPFVVDNDSDGSRHPFGPSVDRIDCSRGYVPDNVRLVTTIANMALNNWGPVPVTIMAEAVAKLHGYSVNPIASPAIT